MTVSSESGSGCEVQLHRSLHPEAVWKERHDDDDHHHHHPEAVWKERHDDHDHHDEHHHPEAVWKERHGIMQNKQQRTRSSKGPIPVYVDMRE